MFKKSIAVLCALSMVFSQVMVFSCSAAKDRTAPALRAATPKNGQKGISIAKTYVIKLKFSENIYKAKKFTKIKLIKISNNKAQTISKRSIYRNYLKVTHKYNLSYSSWYKLYVPAYALKDKAGNNRKKAITIKFKTRAKPVVITPTPTATPTPTPTATPTVAPTAEPTPVNTEFNIASAASVGFPNFASGTHDLGTSNTGNQVMYFDVIPNAENNETAQIGYIDTSCVFDGTEPGDYYKQGIVITMGKDGYFSSVDGKIPSRNAFIKYTSGIRYHVEIQTNTVDKKYSVWITPEGGQKTQLACDFAYRLGYADGVDYAQMDDVGKVVFCSNGAAAGNFTVENHRIAPMANAIAVTPVPTLPTRALGGVNVTNDSELTAALNNKLVGTINMAAGTYAGFTINNPVIINGNGADVTSTIIVNSGNVTVNNLDVMMQNSTTYAKYGYVVNGGLLGVNISGGSIAGNTTGGIGTTMTVGVQIAQSASTQLTINGVAFSMLRKGMYVNDGAGLGCQLTLTSNTFASDVYLAICGTENTTLVSVASNTFNAGREGIGLGVGVNTTAVGQNDRIKAWLEENNTYVGYNEGSGTPKTYGVRDYRPI